MKLRKECPNAECGAGTFMANHHDRHYCGKCGLTYVYGGKKQAERTPIVLWRRPFLILVEATGEVREESVHSDSVQPVIIFCVWILVEVQVQELVLVPVRVRMHLQANSFQDSDLLMQQLTLLLRVMYWNRSLILIQLAGKRVERPPKGSREEGKEDKRYQNCKNENNP
ncbi:hypothetical protein Taro_039964 [Colocasia esculenta]|uniref:Small ribosomal subunit protein eS31 domain-containing protein n=1 Tax=Colocasia esculenta TaxID=4460 RepID=A0A843WBX6_COLES|nr:hypothetical protein [Colocasia esculenta]